LKIKKEEDLFFGIELEIGGVELPETVNSFAGKNENSFFYIKKDTTIPEYGCEIVTYPATLEYHKSPKSKWRKILSDAKKNKFKSYNIDSCGLHIHVNKNFFSLEEITKIDCFVNKNNDFFTKISRRESNYSLFLAKPTYLWGIPINKNKYCALNLCNEQTIEFRMFKGTLNYNSLMSYIELVYSICQFIKIERPLEDYILNQDVINQYKDFVLEQNLPYLHKFINKNNIFE
jgi:hypothetical protein